MTTQQPDWHAYLAQMEAVLGIELMTPAARSFSSSLAALPPWPPR